MKKYEFINYFWGFRARMHYNAIFIREESNHSYLLTSREYGTMKREIKAFADGLSWAPNFSPDDHKKFIRIAYKYLDMVKNGAINPRYDNWGA